MEIPDPAAPLPARGTAWELPEKPGFWRMAPALPVMLFAAAASWSIAAAQTAIVLLAIVLAAGLAAARGRLPERTRTLPWTLRLVFVFLAIQALSIALGIHPTHSLRCFRGSWVMLFPMLFWVGLSPGALRARALRLFTASAALAGLYGAIQHFRGVDWLGGRELERIGGGFMAVGTLGHHLSYAGVLLPAFFLALAFSAASRPRLIWAAAAVAIGLGLTFSYARTSWVGLAAGLLFLALLRGWRALLLLLGVLAAAGLAAAWIEPALFGRVTSILREVAAQGSTNESARARLWLTSLRMAADHPWIGTGLGSFGTLFDQYRVPGDYMSVAHPHSDPLNILVETGIVGLAAWAAIWIAFFREMRPALRRGAGGAQGTPALRRERLVPAALGAGVIALLVGGLGQCFSTDEKVAQVWWFLVAAGLHEARGLGKRALERGSEACG